VAAESGGRRPAIRAGKERWSLLGKLLQDRRADLGYRYRTVFAPERGINVRIVTDIENSYRPNTFLTPTLREIAQAYQVTYDSLIAVLAETADELTPEEPPAPPRAAPPADAGWLPPLPDAAIAAARPYADRIQDRLLELALDGVADPDGGQVFGKGTPDARTWDAIAERWPLRQRVWMMADLHRREQGPGRRQEGNAGLTPA